MQKSVFFLAIFGTICVVTLALPAALEDYIDSLAIGVGEEENPDHADIRTDSNATCILPAQRGHCRALILRWRYERSLKDCVEFKFGGCGGNENNFDTKKQCLKLCQGI